VTDPLYMFINLFRV